MPLAGGFGGSLCHAVSLAGSLIRAEQQITKLRWRTSSQPLRPFIVSLIPFMLNLAAFRYRNIMADLGGPIAKLALCDTFVLGERKFQANSFLRPDLIAWKTSSEVFSDAAGTGTADSPMIARHKAISEAIERWAHMAVVSSPERHRYGFDVDPSSNGMAAFPGLLKRQARPAAYWEAVERCNVLSWWEGRQDAIEKETRWPGVRAAVIQTELPGVTVILFRRSPQGHVAYGHAAGPDFEAACGRAAMELERHDFVVKHYLLVHAGEAGGMMPSTTQAVERRSVFFAQPEGHEKFLERLRTKHWLPALPPRLVYDGPVPGPWSRYADVWRVVYAPPSDRFLGMDENYFML